MEQVKDKNNIILKKVSGFLSDKPLWVWWLSYVAFTGLLFGLSNLVLYLLGIQAWVGILVLIGFGIIWGSISYYKSTGRIKFAAKKIHQEE